jgi:UDP-N-acetyl-D-glucosamine/UDP-N-acetyl-D-galactosamine dehydrogenase
MSSRQIAVIGLGYVGLPLALALAQHTRVIGFDINSVRVKELLKGIDCTQEADVISFATANVFFTDIEHDLAHADVYIIAVPTPVDAAHVPNLDQLMQASTTVAKYLQRGNIVVYESTVYPGVSEDICVPILERVSNLTHIRDFNIAYSPERINPGDKQHTLHNTIKIVSAIDSDTLEIVAAIYASIVSAGIHRLNSIKVAEAAKVIENAQRDLNIAFMNELAVLFDKMALDTADILQAAGTKWNFLQFKPGLVGGHCIGVDPYYLTYKAEQIGYIPQVILAGRRINDSMGRFIARKGVKLLLQYGLHLPYTPAIVLGFSFKENCPDVRNTKVIDIIHELEDYHITVFCHDPIANAADAEKQYSLKLWDFTSLPIVPLLIIAVGHESFCSVDIATVLSKVVPGGIILDVKSILDKSYVLSLGYRLWRL